MAEPIIAKYLRLSLDDAQTGSMSIEHQRLILDQYIADTGMSGDIREYVDNGYSGVSFERPGIQELLELVRQSRVQCILIKDFSRFGRNAIETGYFIERVFPLYHVRLISISDGFDSAEHEGDTGGMEVAFKLLIHEYYSQDLSRKIRSAKQEKARRGEFVTRNCAFGYKLDEQRKMVIDPEAAETVRMIFTLYVEGKSVAEIRKQLCAQHRPTPKAWKHHQSFLDRPEKLQCVWDVSVIRKILCDEQYTGTYIAGKTQIIDVGSHVRKCNDSADWIRISEHHPAIIVQELFDHVQRKVKEEKRPRGQKCQVSTESTSLLKGKVRCAHCKHSMQLSQTKNAAFHCRFTLPVPDAACHHLRISSAELENMVYVRMTQQAQLVLAERDSQHDKGSCECRLDELQREKQQLYECLVLGEFSPEEYKAQKAQIDAEVERVRQVTSVQDKNKQTALCTTSVKAAQVVLKSDLLTQELVDLLIDRVFVHPDGKIDILWKHAAFDHLPTTKTTQNIP